MKYTVLDGYATELQKNISRSMMSSAVNSYRTAEEFAGNDQDKGVLSRLEAMRRIIGK